MAEARLLPNSNGSNGWWEILPSANSSRVLTGQRRARTAIIGCGICGVATAHRLGELRPGDEIVLIEAEQAGFGASGRNAGFMLNMHSHGPPKDLAILRRNLKLWEFGLDDLRRKTRRFQIQCDWRESGRYYGAAGKDGEQHVEEITQTLDRLGQSYTRLSHTELEQKTGTRFYSLGLYAPGNALVNPAALMRGLAHNLPANVSLYEKTPVLGFERHGQGYVVNTPHGRLLADRLVLATGVFLEHFGIGKRQFVPMATYASMTGPLSDSVLGNFGEASDFGLLGGSAYGSTIRLTADRRLFVRNYFHYHPGNTISNHRLRSISAMHRQAMLRRWPEMHAVDFEHCWGGVMAFTTNNGSLFGEIEPGLFVVLTSDVSPMTRGASSGLLLADLMENRDSELLDVQLSIPEARRLPPRPILDLGVAWHKGALHFAAHREF